jgi:hypothetical protein
VAEVLPVARAFREAGNHVTRAVRRASRDLIILEEELRQAADEMLWATDDGSYGFHGTVVDLMRPGGAACGPAGCSPRHRPDSHDARRRRADPRQWGVRHRTPA